MLTRRNIVLCTTCAMLAAPARAADAAALAFVTAIYDAYKGKGAHGVPIDNEGALRRYFEPSLAASIRKDQKDAARRNEPPQLDGDPFVDAQDWEIASFDIAVSDTAPGKASATVNFTNQGERTVVLELVKIKND
jgi:Protein of unknown function (DUF3828)